MGQTNTSRSIHHLKKHHTTDVKREELEKGQMAAATIPQYFSAVAGAIARAGYRALVSHIDADNFRWLLIQWIVCMHVALTVIKSEEFRAVILLIAPALEEFIVNSNNTIRAWTLEAFERKRDTIKKKLAKIRMVHFSFDGLPQAVERLLELWRIG